MPVSQTRLSTVTIEIADGRVDDLQFAKGLSMVKLHFPPKKMIVPLIDDESAYAAAFEQTGYGMPRYTGSPMMGGSFWGRMISFAKGLFKGPHLPYLTSYRKLNHTSND